ncbi:MAG: hypothetical protein QM731_20725 [Chitinophagaceae bacterium]
MPHLLYVEGLLSEKAKDMLSDADIYPEFPFADWLFMSFALDDVPLNTVFNQLVVHGSSQISYPVNACLIKITQQFFKLFDEVPSGWKTICLVQFDEPSYKFVKGVLPVLETWSYKIQYDLISDESQKSEIGS